MDAIHASREERVLGRRLFDELCAKPDRLAYGVLVERIMRDLHASRAAVADASAARA